jgi:hypothetical protein
MLQKPSGRMPGEIPGRGRYPSEQRLKREIVGFGEVEGLMDIMALGSRNRTHQDVPNQALP